MLGEVGSCVDGAAIVPHQEVAQTPDVLVDELAAFADVEFPVPVPRPGTDLSAREAFLYLILFTTLYITACSLGSLIFDLINQGFPDAAEDAYRAAYTAQSIRWNISALVVAFPTFLFMARVTGRRLQLDPGKRTSAVRRWLTYLTLFVAACVLIGDVTTLANAEIVEQIRGMAEAGAGEE